MRRLISLSGAVVLAVAVLAACNSTEKNQGASGSGSSKTNSGASQSAQPTPGDGVRRITLAELRAALDQGTAIVVDTRDANSYKANHIKGSINIPADQIANHINELPRDKLIVAYCS